jgi:hypothetical protein
MIDRTQLTEVLEWWVDVVADVQTDTFTLTMSRTMAERTLAAIDQLLDFPTDQQVVEAVATFLKRPQGEDIEDTMREVLLAVGQIGGKPVKQKRVTVPDAAGRPKDISPWFGTPIDRALLTEAYADPQQHLLTLSKAARLLLDFPTDQQVKVAVDAIGPRGRKALEAVRDTMIGQDLED